MNCLQRLINKCDQLKSVCVINRSKIRGNMGFTLYDKRYLGISECSQYIGVTKGTLYVWVCHKKIPYLKVGRLVKFDIKVIEKWLSEKQIQQIN